MTRATIVTDKGAIEIELSAESAPRATANFVELARKGFYDGVVFHRLVSGFVIQGGDGEHGHIDRLDRGRLGTGGPGYKFADEPFEGDYVRGAVAMANAGPNTNGSQFFICLTDLSGGRLPKKYTLLGTVTKGMDVVDAIAASKCDSRDQPVEPTAMRSVRIAE
ncbi:MAG TPA: peptidylprolyl isomerase [Candidatus Limnocylindrales bacterium]|jgi:cyclophilin family peptidyl-prolyl cis-trans isomerase